MDIEQVLLKIFIVTISIEIKSFKNVRKNNKTRSYVESPIINGRAPFPHHLLLLRGHHFGQKIPLPLRQHHLMQKNQIFNN